MMKYTKSNMIGDAGEHLVASRIIKLFGFPCRLINIDIGLDAEIEIIDDNCKSTGEFLKCQVKTTTSKNLFLNIQVRHIKYWNKINIPVIIFLVHIDTEEIYWHCVDDFQNYNISGNSFKIEFDKNNILLKENKEKFKDLANCVIIKEIRKIYNESYLIALEEKTQLEEGDYDLTSAEIFVSNANKIERDLKKINKLLVRNNSLKKIEKEYYNELKLITEYLHEVNEVKQVIIDDYGSEYFDYLNNE